jgi:hypothetical protein
MEAQQNGSKHAIENVVCRVRGAEWGQPDGLIAQCIQGRLPRRPVGEA